MRDIDQLFEALQKSAFRRRFRLAASEHAYLAQKTLPKVLEHAADFIEKRLAPALPVKDGKQTPYRGHPVFVAQHATATCCRSCLVKWHKIPSGRPLTQEERNYILKVLAHWIGSQMG
ncbi:MAG: DUF4186 domain-containing protein [Rhodomicrobium sp.]